jgi:hypothetical protein
MPGLIKRLFRTGSAQRPTDHKGETSSDPRLAIIAAAAPDPSLAAEDKPAFEEERKEAAADSAVARSETPSWMRLFVGELPAEYRMGIGILVLILVIVAFLAALGGRETSQTVLTQLLDMLKAILGGIAGGALVKRANGRSD